MRLGGRGLLLVFCGLLVALVVSVAASADNYRFGFTAVGQAAARAVVLRRADLGAVVSWKGGAKKPDLSAQPTCPNYQPKLSDLVVTGAAESDYSTVGLELDSEVEVLQTAAMVRLDLLRSVTATFLPCLRSQFAASARTKLVSLRRIPFPHLATFTAAFRLVTDIAVPAGTERVVVDVVVVGSGRTEITLTSTAPLVNKQVVAAADLRLVRILVGRARA